MLVAISRVSMLDPKMAVLCFQNLVLSPNMCFSYVSVFPIENGGIFQCHVSLPEGPTGGDCRYWPVSAWRQFEVRSLSVFFQKSEFFLFFFWGGKVVGSNH